MGLKKMLKGSSKGQLMTLVMLIIFVLLLAELFAFALLNINSNSISQSLTLTSSSANYGSLFKLSANNFASASLSRAITTLASYESAPAYRKGNLITNTSLYLSYLVTNGVLPNDTSGYPQNAMGNLTLKLYNLSAANVIGFATQSVTVNETQPLVFQTDPYHIRMAYTERIAVNSSGNDYRYTIPVNVSLPLNGTPDLFYSQQGLSRQIRFAGLANITSVIGGVQATSGNTLSYGYGTVYWLQSNSISGAACSSIPAAVSAAAVSGNIVLATYNAIGLESCENSYAGLITYTAPSTLPTVAYLVYPSSSNLLQLVPTGTQVLVYGPALETLNIEGLRNAVSNSYYFASPFTPSYLDRAQGNFNTQSPNGVFSFSNYNRETGNFDGASSLVSVPVSSSLSANTLTITAWINQATLSGSAVGVFGANQVAACSGYLLSVNPFGSAAGAGRPGIGGECTTSVQANSQIKANTWYFIAGTYDGSTYKIYVNGAVSNTLSYSQTFTNAGNFFIGAFSPPSSLFNGRLANLQVYNTALPAQQIQKLYQEGISGLPIPGNLVGLWPLNGNANDYSGQGNNGVATSVSYNLLANYSRDSILNTPVPTKLSPIPGMLSCTSTGDCASNTLPNLYLGYMPLEVQNAFLQATNFNGNNGFLYSASKNPLNPNTGAFAFSAWVYTSSVADQPFFASKGGFTNLGYDGFIQTDNTVHCEFDDGTVDAIAISVNTVGLNTWNFLTCVRTGTGSTQNYLNGILEKTSTVSTGSNNINPNNNFNIGKDTFSSPAGYLNGNIANTQIYNSSLSASQVLQLYREGLAGLPLSGNLVAWYPLNGNSDDYSGDAFNLTTANVIFTNIESGYTSPGLSSIAATASEWQALGLASPQ